MYDTSIDPAPTTRRSAVEMLNEHLADAIDVPLQPKQAHWNIKGPDFVGLSQQSQLREYPLEAGDWRADVVAMQDALATFGRGLRKTIDGCNSAERRRYCRPVH